jgi:hypothetical protein
MLRCVGAREVRAHWLALVCERGHGYNTCLFGLHERGRRNTSPGAYRLTGATDDADAQASTGAPMALGTTAAARRAVATEVDGDTHLLGARCRRGGAACARRASWRVGRTLREERQQRLERRRAGLVRVDELAGRRRQRHGMSPPGLCSLSTGRRRRMASLNSGVYRLADGLGDRGARRAGVPAQDAGSFESTCALGVGATRVCWLSECVDGVEETSAASVRACMRKAARSAADGNTWLWGGQD